MTKNSSKVNLPTPQIPNIPSIKTLPYNGSAISEKGFSFSFSCFDHSHELFNLGDTNKNGVVDGSWFIDLLDCFRSVNSMTVQQVKESLHDLHPVDWKKANAKRPLDSDQQEYWQFRINKSKGRIIGILIDGIFYVVWLDPHHNLTDSDGYGKARYYTRALSTYEKQEQYIKELEEKNCYLEQLLEVANQLL